MKSIQNWKKIPKCYLDVEPSTKVKYLGRVGSITAKYPMNNKYLKARVLYINGNNILMSLNLQEIILNIQQLNIQILLV